MSSIKAKKGNPFEYDTLYSLIKGKYNAIRMDDNSKGVDIIIKEDDLVIMGLECKRHKGFTWNKLVETYNKTKETVENEKTIEPYIIFKANRQPTLVFHSSNGSYTVNTFEDVFGCEWKKRPKGWNLFTK